MKKQHTNLYNNIEEDSVDIIYLLKNVWIERKLILKITISFFFIGCVVALLSPVVYTSQTTFIPQVSDDKISKSGLASFASLAGINLNQSDVTNDSYLSPLLYSKLAESEEFAYDIIKEEITNLNGDKLTIKEYLLSNESSFNVNLVGFIKKYTVGLFINDKKIENKNDILKNYNYLSQEDFVIVNSFTGMYTIELDEKNGYIKVKATDKDAFISTQLVEKITKNLQSKIIKLRTTKIRERLGFSKEQYELKQSEFDLLQKKLADFKDSNKNISTARFMSELQKLETEFQLQKSILINLASEYNNNKIKLNKDTPIFSVIDEVSIPNLRSAPKRSLLVMTFVLIGFGASVIFIFCREPIRNLINEIKE